MTWRRSWARNWDEVRYCSSACRRRRVSDSDRQLETAILELLAARRGSICPGEAARAVAGEDDWRALLEPVRRAARRLVEQGRVEITQGGRPVDPSTARGPIRIRGVEP
jgi:hypothetical protein